MSALQDVLDFWFAPDHVELWYEKNDLFDAAVARHLSQHHEAARRGVYDAWRELPRGSLALVILLDQVPRNIFRGQARAFATDPQARAVVGHALDRGYHRILTEQECKLLYMPLEHSEDLLDQELCCRLMAALSQEPEFLSYAERHREIIRRFGRFPHRNAALGRPTTDAEADFLKEPMSSF